MSLNFCDLLVIGSDLSGLIAATLLAKRGLSVVIIDDDAYLDNEPNGPTGLHSRLFKSLLGKLAFPEARLQIIHKNNVAFQVISPKSRIDILPKQEDFLKEIEREFPETRQWYENFLNEIEFTHRQDLEILFGLLPLHNQRERHHFAQLQQKILDAMEKSIGTPPDSLVSFLNAQILLHTNGILLPHPRLQWLALLLPDYNETFNIRGGIAALKRLFYEKIEYYGGSVYQDPLTNYEFILQNNLIRGIQLSRLGFPTHCRYFLSNIPIHHLASRLPQTFLIRLINRTLIPSPSRGHQYYLQFLLPYKFLPVPMHDNVIVIQNPHEAFEGPNYVKINVSPPPKVIASEGQALLTISYFLKKEDYEMIPSRFESIHEEIEEIVNQIIPFAKEHLQRVFPAKGEQSDSLFPESSFNDFIKLSHRHPLYEPTIHSPKLSSPYSNHYVLGPDLLSWLEI